MSKIFKPTWRVLSIYIFVASPAVLIVGLSTSIKAVNPAYLVGGGIVGLTSALLFFFVKDSQKNSETS